MDRKAKIAAAIARLADILADSDSYSRKTLIELVCEYKEMELEAAPDDAALDDAIAGIDSLADES